MWRIELGGNGRKGKNGERMGMLEKEFDSLGGWEIDEKV